MANFLTPYITMSEDKWKIIPGDLVKTPTFISLVDNNIISMKSLKNIHREITFHKDAVIVVPKHITTRQLLWNPSDVINDTGSGEPIFMMPTKSDDV